MKKVLLLSCFLSLTVHAGTGGGTSTPPARAGLAQLLAKALGIGLESGQGELLLEMDSPLPLQWTLPLDTEERTADFTSLRTVTLINLKGESRSYLIEDGELLHSLNLTDRRAALRTRVQP